MLKVNLERELLRQRKAEISAKELLLINEYDQLAVMPDDTKVLDRVGIAGAAKEGKEIKQRTNNLKSETSRFNQDRVFHISQIERLCNKYYLRFLPAIRYKGHVDSQLAGKICQVEAAYGVTMRSGHKSSFWPYNYDNCNAFIIAPASSFELEETPKDPLFFYKINDQYYYLVHKWGNDLSIWNRMKAIMSTPWVWAILFVLLSLVISRFPYIWEKDSELFAHLMMYVVFPAIATGAIAFLCDGRLLPKNNFTSPIE